MGIIWQWQYHHTITWTHVAVQNHSHSDRYADFHDHFRIFWVTANGPLSSNHITRFWKYIQYLSWSFSFPTWYGGEHSFTCRSTGITYMLTTSYGWTLNLQCRDVDYQLGDNILLLTDSPSTLQDQSFGLFLITHVYTNGTVTVEHSPLIQEHINIWQMKPFCIITSFIAAGLNIPQPYQGLCEYRTKTG